MIRSKTAQVIASLKSCSYGSSVHVAHHMMYPFLSNAASVEDASSPIYFLHIPKTGGTTLGAFLESQYRIEDICPAHSWSQLLTLPPTEIAKYRLIWGHFYPYIAKHVPILMRYMVFLRDPVERAMSHYAHIVSRSSHYFHDRAVALGNFSAFLKEVEMATAVSNFQVRSLALDLEPQTIASKLTREELCRWELERRLETSPFDRTIDQMLEAAKFRLRQMCFVGITERFDESIAVLCRRFQWPRPMQIKKHNVTDSQWRRSQLSSE